MSSKKLVVAIVGPTGSCKTSLALNLAEILPKKEGYLSAEVISCDSRQIYKEMDIATAKPLKEELLKIPHHLIDFVSPDRKDFSVAVYVEMAQKIINELLCSNKLPLIVGGTGLYFKSLLGEFDIPRVPPNFELRTKLNEKSNDELYKILSEKDSELAGKIHKNNKNKVIRALEVIESLNLPMSKVQKKKQCPYDVLWIGLTSKNRDFLYNRINNRCDEMLKSGLLDELNILLKKYGKTDLIDATIGYSEFLPYLKGNISYEEAVEKFKQHTRNYAKRQLSWFRADKNINWFYIDEMSEKQILEDIIRLCS